MNRQVIRTVAVMGLLALASGLVAQVSPGGGEVKRKGSVSAAFDAARTLGKPIFIVIENPHSS